MSATGSLLQPASSPELVPSAVPGAVPVLDPVFAEIREARGQPRPVALYVHVPFCATKCHFCDWVSDVPVQRLRSDELQRKPYIDALVTQVRFWGRMLRDSGYVPHVLYWGGGTPTRLGPAEMRTVKRALDEAFDTSSLAQFSVETTPDSATEEKLATLRDLGVNRVSIGVQSFDDRHLQMAGRGHDRGGAMAAIERVRQCGFETFNVDLVTGFPDEKIETWRTTLEMAVALGVPHLSVYLYRPTNGTVMAAQLVKGRRASTDRQHMLAFYEVSMEILRSAGYTEYTHGYWIKGPEHLDVDAVYKYGLQGDRLGFGNGAESLLGHHLVFSPPAAYERYLREPCETVVLNRLTLENAHLLAGHLAGALMTPGGIDFAGFQAMTGLRFEDYRQTPFFKTFLNQLHALEGALVEKPGSLALDARWIHRVYANYVTQDTSLSTLQELQGYLF